MRFSSRFAMMVLLLPMAAMSWPLYAQESDIPRNNLTLGLGVGTVPSYTGSDDNIIIPALVLRGRLNGYNFTSRGVNLSVDLIRQKRGQDLDFKFGPLINIRTERSGSVGDAQVEALGKRKSTLEAGVWGGVSKTGVFTGDHDQIGAKVSVLQDTMGRHRSHIISTSVEYSTPLSKTTYLGLQAAVTYVGKGYGRTYYDVTPAGSAASGLAAYDRAGSKGGASKASLSFAAAKALSGDLRKGWVLVAGGQYGRLLGRYADSPIVSDAGSADQFLGGVGVVYNF